MPLKLNERRMQTLGSETVKQQTVAGLQSGERNQRMLVVHETDVRRVADQFRSIERHCFIELKGIARTPKIAVREKQLVQRCVNFDGGFQVEKIH